MWNLSGVHALRPRQIWIGWNSSGVDALRPRRIWIVRNPSGVDARRPQITPNTWKKYNNSIISTKARMKALGTLMLVMACLSPLVETSIIMEKLEKCGVIGGTYNALMSHIAPLSLLSTTDQHVLNSEQVSQQFLRNACEYIRTAINAIYTIFYHKITQ